MPDVNVPIIPQNFTPVGTMVKPPQPTWVGAMSLGDVVNMARGVQEYQQRQQLNPIEIQQQQSRFVHSQVSSVLHALVRL